MVASGSRYSVGGADKSFKHVKVCLSGPPRPNIDLYRVVNVGNFQGHRNRQRNGGVCKVDRINEFKQFRGSLVEPRRRPWPMLPPKKGR